MVSRWYVLDSIFLFGHDLTCTGNYLISGGSETVLVLWQTDTGKTQFLPHMSATIQNVAISPSGISYGVQLADNSTLVLSTVDLLPTANIAGVQACSVASDESINSRVQRVGDDVFSSPLVQRTPAVINPMEPSQLLLGVGQAQEISAVDTPITSVTALQAFDLTSGHNISRQALTRSNVTNVNISPSAHRISEPRITHMQISSDGTWLATVDQWSPPDSDVDSITSKGADGQAGRRYRREVHLKFWQFNTKDGIWELTSRINAPHASMDGQGAGLVLDMVVDPDFSRFSTLGDDGVVHIWSNRARNKSGVGLREKDASGLRAWYCQHTVSLGRPDFYNESENTAKPYTPSSGCLAFSEDGSTLAAAWGGHGPGLLHLLDTELGTVRLTHSGLLGGDVLQMRFLGQNLIALSDWISVYDLVFDEMKYRIKLGASVTSMSLEQRQEMMHLAVDQKNQTFAVALPTYLEGQQGLDPRGLPLSVRYSELAVFHQDKREPLLKKKLSTLVTALLPTGTYGGYFILDTAAELRTVLKKGSQAITSMAQSTSALELDAEVLEEATESISELVSATTEEIQDELEAHHQDSANYDIEEDQEAPIVTQQQLSEIFHAGPAFALPPIEEMFFQVAGLFSGQPRLQSV